jgi:DNA-binding transcriptional LysR family regulator
MWTYRSRIADNDTVDTRRLQLLLALSRLGSMRAVAQVHNLTTSTVSQQIAALAKDTGAQLIEPEGRRVRLTPAGRRLADHAVEILVDVAPSASSARQTTASESPTAAGALATSNGLTPWGYRRTVALIRGGHD